jgi:hypothetical protein
MLSIFSMHLASLRDSFEEIEVVESPRYGGGVSYGGYWEPEMGKGTEEILKFQGATGIDVFGE